MPDHDNTPSSPFGRGWIPAGRDIGLGEDGGGGLARGGGEPVCASSAFGAACDSGECAENGAAGAGVGRNLPVLRHDAFTPDRQARFVQALSVGGSVRSACAAVGISPQAAYLCRRRSGHFAAAWDAALVLAREHAEQVLAERALDGVEEAVFYHGEQVAVRRRFEGRLLLAQLARLDRKVESRPDARRRAARFDELLAGLIGEGPAQVADRPRRPGHDPYLPPDRADHVALATDGLGPRAYPRARRRAEAEWDHWRARAEQAVDRLFPSPAPADREYNVREYKSARPPALTPAPPPPAFSPGTVSTVSTSPARQRTRARRAGPQKSTAMPFCSQSP